MTRAGDVELLHVGYDKSDDRHLWLAIVWFMFMWIK